MNLDRVSTGFSMYFRGYDGKPLAVPIDGVGSVMRLDGTIAAKGTVTFKTDGSGDLILGYALVFNSSTTQVALNVAGQYAMALDGELGSFAQSR